MTGDIAAVAGFRIIVPGSLRISENILNYDIGRFKKVKMNGGPVGKAVVANSAIARVSALRMSTFSVRSDGSGKCRAIRREVMA
jgi:hypothetical protein